MATTDGFKFWASYYDALKALDTDKQRSDFMLALCAYVFDGVEPEFDDPVVRFGYTLVAEQARQSMEISRAAREGGLKSGKSRREKAKPNTAQKGVRKGVRKGVSNVSGFVGTSVPTTNLSSTPTVAPGGVLAPPPAPDNAPPPLP